MNNSNIFGHTTNIMEIARRLTYHTAPDNIFEELHELKLELNGQEHAETRILATKLRHKTAYVPVLKLISQANQEEETIIQLCSTLQNADMANAGFQQNLSLLHRHICEHITTEERLVILLRDSLPWEDCREILESVESEKITLISRDRTMEAGG